MNNVICIYKITSPTNRIYIGQTIDYYKRKAHYKNLLCTLQPKLYSSFKKYGFENHEMIILHECKKEDLDKLEQYYINHYNSMNYKTGLNLKEGGHFSKWSDESKLKLSKSKTGFKYSDKSKLKMSISRKGKQSPRKGAIVSFESRIKMSIAKQHMTDITKYKMSIAQTGRKLSEETKLKISINNGNSRLNKLNKVKNG